ncbi:MAG: NapC/NirT family cytochrome c [Acidobacteriia bacterium]|nr:NapC/NirT family cytochrome c [Terriglobia bacterium]
MRNLFATISRNLTSLAGVALTTAAAILFVAMFLVEAIGIVEAGPYVGILGFLVLPGLFLLGLVLIPAGLWLERRRDRRIAERGGAPPALPVFDFNDPRTRKTLLLLLALTTLNLAILGVAGYKGVEVMDSTSFCGSACHSVMAPEYANYQRSPHARVGCVSCHIGPGANWFVKSKLSGSWQLIAVMFDLYPKPIPTPVRNLRPARETCEQCHWPTKFVGDRLKVLTHYAEDEANTELKNVLLLRVGGAQGRSSKGIHWHVDPAIQIRYRSDEKRESISEVELTLPDRTVKTFKTGGDPAKAAAAEETWRTMDCVDCHNRPTHIYRMPQDEMDAALREQRIDRSLPFVRREGLKALEGAYASHEEARARIREQVLAFYAKNYPEVASGKRDLVTTAAEELGKIYCVNVWPSMHIAWGTYANHIGHQHAPGCFRCHDGEHKTALGEEISQDCSTCHTLLAQEEKEPAILKELQP